MPKIFAVLLFCCLFTPTLLLAATPPALIPQTGQATSYAAGDDGDLEKGVALPVPRFVDQGNGTVTDKLTGLIWLKNANCFGTKTWADALVSANTLASSYCGLSDSSVPGSWRLPNITELESLVDTENANPALPSGHPFTGVQSDRYWSSSTYASNSVGARNVQMFNGSVYVGEKSGNGYYVWPVRGGQDL